MKPLLIAAVLIAGLIGPATAASPASGPPIVLAQAMVPPTGMDDADKPMPMVDRMNRRFPQPVRVGDLIGLPVLDDSSSTLGYVRQVVRTPRARSSSSFPTADGSAGGRPVAVPIEAVGIEGRQMASLDMPRSEYATAPTWQGKDATVLPDDASIRDRAGRRN